MRTVTTELAEESQEAAARIAFLQEIASSAQDLARTAEELTAVVGQFTLAEA